MAEKSQAVEIDEAIAAADEALGYLDDAADQLGRAGNWGLADMLGGGFFSTFMKHRRIDDAQESIENARRAVRKFAKELQDVHSSHALNVEVDGFLQFADYFMDGIVADWLVQSKIDKSKRQVKEARREVQQLRNELAAMRK